MRADTDLKAEKIERPAKAWRNWWRIPLDAKSILRKPGEVYCSRQVYQSKDAAETDAGDAATIRAAKVSIQLGNAPLARVSEYLGAFPEGTRPGRALNSSTK